MRARTEEARPLLRETSFRDRFVALFDRHFTKIFRYLDRMSGDPDLAADIAQETFVRLYRTGRIPDSPEAWLVSVARNLFRNARTTTARRRRLLTPVRAARGHGDPPAAPGLALDGSTTRQRVRAALDRLDERDRSLLLLRAEGYSYRDLARMLGLHEASVGTLLARARQTFRKTYGEGYDAT